MALFRRILDFTPQSAAQTEKRHSSRYELPTPSPINCTLTQGEDAWPCQIKNLSCTGANLLIKSKSHWHPGDQVQVRFDWEKHHFATPAKIVHLQTDSDSSAIGLAFAFTDFEARKTYLQLLEPISIGVGMSSQGQRVQATEPGFETIRYHGIGQTLLTVWRGTEDGMLTGFEFRMNDYYVRNDQDRHLLKIYVSARDHSSLDEGIELQRTDQASDEIKLLYRWVLAYLNPELPEDVRTMLQAHH
ncbi:MAG: PilZ domain-containing protein [Opitutaceae bacterium]